jgi:alkylation response protein AidB-like acyl-CoA dehydrogenase
VTDLEDQDVDALAAALDQALADHRDAPGDGAWLAYTELGLFDIVGAVARPAPVLAALFRMAGRHLAPGPLVEEIFVRPWLAANVACETLPGPGSDGRLALVDPAATWDWRAARGEVQLAGGGLYGAVRGIPHAPRSSMLVVVVTENGSERLAVVPADAPGVHIEPGAGLDPGCPIGTVRFTGCQAEVPELRPDTLAALRCWLRLLAGAELSGIADAVVEMTSAHTVQREQFSHPIASFQAVRHILADMATHAIALGNLVNVTAREFGELPRAERDEAAAITKAYASAAALRICEQGLQLHGGMGFVEEYGLHLYFKAALRLHGHYGTPGELHDEIGAQLTGSLRRLPVAVLVPVQHPDRVAARDLADLLVRQADGHPAAWSGGSGGIRAPGPPDQGPASLGRASDTRIATGIDLAGRCRDRQPLFLVDVAGIHRQSHASDIAGLIRNEPRDRIRDVDWLDERHRQGVPATLASS